MPEPDERTVPAGPETRTPAGRPDDGGAGAVTRRPAPAHDPAADGGEPAADRGGAVPAGEGAAAEGMDAHRVAAESGGTDGAAAGDDGAVEGVDTQSADAGGAAAGGATGDGGDVEGGAGHVAAAGGPHAAEGPVVVSPSVYRRLMSGLPGYALAMLCCLAIVGLVLLLTPRRNQNAVLQVDYRGDLAGLVAVAPYSVWAPEGLPQGWYPTSSRLTGTAGGPVAWHLGFYTPAKQYAALEESDERPDGHGGFADRMTSQGRPDGTATVAGVSWDRTFRKDKNQRSLVRRLPGVTLVVTGTASYDELAVLAGSLRQQPKPSPGASVIR